MPRYTRFHHGESSSIQDIYAALINDEQRNDLIFDDVLLALEQKRFPILLTERTAHVDYFAVRLKPFAKNVLVLRGGMGKKQLDQVLKQLKELPDDAERVIIATGRFIGEGFDDPRLGIRCFWPCRSRGKEHCSNMSAGFIACIPIKGL
ncbi:hypothetical protein [Ammoniphilus sp. YIM 78166]|uniref:hypothetical protein n=1 Tax=Ammoniphilus sp. YIM 78166 TaxID=1644106 RepID=UPI001F0CE9FE|nr:hypothetical protein [Ammoniphilus sp. YIM 78166]